MEQNEKSFDFTAFGQEVRRRRKEKGWTQIHLAQLIDRTDRTILNIENKGQCPSVGILFKIVTLLDISVDQFFYPRAQEPENERLKRIDRALIAMTENELIVMEATAEGLQKARDNES